ncbi:MAG: hypothetical protein V1821_01075, partial [bacterium]
MNAIRCKQCQQEFEVNAASREILGKLDCPLPALCFACATQNGLTYRNERHLYRRDCELCKKSILAMYAPGSYIHVYCRDCWFSDNWDPISLGRDYDPKRPFMEQFFELLHEVPQFNFRQIGTNENAEYSNNIYNAKNVFLGWSIVAAENIAFSKNVDSCNDCVDCLDVQKSELLYNCVDTSESFQSAYLTRVSKCSDCFFCRDLEDCQNCFGSVNLRHKKFCWFNERLSEIDYRAKVGQAFSSRQSLEEVADRFAAFSSESPVEYATIRNSENVTGEYLRGDSNAQCCFESYESENI